MSAAIYNIHRISPVALHTADFGRAEQGCVRHARPESSAHRPHTTFELLHDTATLYLRFTVHDRFVRVAHSALH